MKRCVWIFMLLLMLLSACTVSPGENVKGDIVFQNRSDVSVYAVSVTCGNETVGGQHADGTPLEQGEYLAFDLDLCCPAVVAAYGMDGEVLASCTIAENICGQWKVRLTGNEAGDLSLEAERREEPA